MNMNSNTNANATTNTRIVDLRSDTVTKPSQAMYQAMVHAEVGDDVMREDPTVDALEKRVSAFFGKEAALFFPSGTMSNLAALLTWCSARGSEFIVGDQSHIFLYEQAGAAQFGGISPRNVPNLPDGTLDLSSVQMAIREYDIHEPITRLICIENTHNACGGKVLPLSFLKELKTLATSNPSSGPDPHNHLPIHMDGARIWNALTAYDYDYDQVSSSSPSEIASHVDSLTVCLSKGLGAPVGSLLVGPQDFIDRARRIRKALGGGMRQSGVLAAAGLQALDDFESGILKRDHERAQQIAASVRTMTSFQLMTSVETNIVFLKIVLYDPERKSGSSVDVANATTETISSRISGRLRERGVLVSAWAPYLLRLVVHRDINDEDIQYTIQCIEEIDESFRIL